MVKTLHFVTGVFCVTLMQDETVRQMAVTMFCFWNSLNDILLHSNVLTANFPNLMNY